ncbi:unnamed protein product [Rotaria sp. Silwood2]|nr:unnamed protein product [Rotaria sp. Silwood2]CAF4372211.1 unnamed protein product [Rotaria sp. Silwood2]
MKIIIFSILFTVQGLNIDDGLISNENSSITNDLNVVTQMINESDRTVLLQTSNDILTSRFDIDQINLPTILPENISSDVTFDSQTWPSLFVYDNSSLSSFLPTTDFYYTTSSEEVKITMEQQWFNINQSHARDPYKSILVWKHASVGSRWHGGTYILTSKPSCVRQMCSVRLKYNGTLPSLTSGCLSFTLRTRGQPVGQLWIIEDREQENTPQKIQLTSKTLHIEHSLKSKIKNLSIETRILFRNPQIDTVILSNLNIDWKGACPKQRSIPTPSPHIIARRATLEDGYMTLTSEDSNLSSTLITNEEFTISQQSFIYETTTTTIFNQDLITKSSFCLVNQKNIGWFLLLITLFCFFIVLCAIGHGLWLIRRQRYFTWHVTFDSQIHLIARRSIRSSTRSETKIATVSQIAYDILNDDLQKEHTDTQTTNSNRSTPISYYTYL